MPNERVYILDANVFIESAKRHYAFDLAPGFWVALAEYGHQGRLLSIDRVKDEIDRQNDELRDWATEHFGSWFFSTSDQSTLEQYREIIEWGRASDHYKPQAKRQLADAKRADAWVVAYATVHDYIVVTDERPNPLQRNKVPIPSICDEFNVPFVDTFDMLRMLGVTFR